MISVFSATSPNQNMKKQLYNSVYSKDRQGRPQLLSPKAQSGRQSDLTKKAYASKGGFLGVSKDSAVAGVNGGGTTKLPQISGRLGKQLQVDIGSAGRGNSSQSRQKTGAGFLSRKSSSTELLTDEFNELVRKKYNLAAADEINKLDYKERNK